MMLPLIERLREYANDTHAVTRDKAFIRGAANIIEALVEAVIALLETRSVEDEAAAIAKAEAVLIELGVNPRDCPACNGDCSAANPPVLNCPMRRDA